MSFGQIAFALVLDTPTFNATQELSVALWQEFQLVPRTATYTPHISFKQPFACDDLEAVEAYFDAFATGWEPVEIKVGEMKIYEYPDNGRSMAMLWLEVAANSALRNMHREVNAGLKAKFENTAAPFDGDNYRFHLTLAGGQPCEVLQPAYEAYKGQDFGWCFTAREIAMFYLTPGWAMIYKIAPLGKTTKKLHKNGVQKTAELAQI